MCRNIPIMQGNLRIEMYSVACFRKQNHVKHYIKLNLKTISYRPIFSKHFLELETFLNKILCDPNT